MSQPEEAQLKEAKHTLQYIKHTLDYEFFHKKKIIVKLNNIQILIENHVHRYIYLWRLTFLY